MIEKALIVVRGLERRDFRLDKFVERGQIGHDFRRQIEIQGGLPFLSETEV